MRVRMMIKMQNGLRPCGSKSRFICLSIFFFYQSVQTHTHIHDTSSSSSSSSSSLSLSDFSLLIYPGFFSLPRLGVIARHFFRSRANSAQVLIGSPRWVLMLSVQLFFSSPCLFCLQLCPQESPFAGCHVSLHGHKISPFVFESYHA